MPTNYNYPAGCGVCLGVFHILFGLISCGCGIAAVVWNTYFSQYGVGIWAGIAFYSVTGILALASSGRNNSVITGYYVMALLSVFVAMGQMGAYCWVVVYEVASCESYYNGQYYYDCWTDTNLRYVILYGILLLVAFLEWIIAMVSCCTACSCCCGSGVVPTQTIVLQSTHHMPDPALQAYGGPAAAAVMMPPPQALYAGGQPIPGPAMQVYAGPGVAAVMMPPPPPQAQYGGGQPGVSAPNYPMHSQLPQDFNDKSKLLLDGAPYVPPVFHNQTFEETARTDIASLPTAEF